MNPEEWEKHWAEGEKTLAKIDAIYKWKLHLIAKQRRLAYCFFTGYVVLLFTGIIFANYVIILIGMGCAFAVVGTGAWMGYQLRSNPYPVDDDG